MRDLVLILLVSIALTAGLLVACAPAWWAIEVSVLLAIPAVAAVFVFAYLASLGAFGIVFRRHSAALTIDEAATWVAQEIDRRSSTTSRGRARSSPTLAMPVVLTKEKARLAELIYPRFRRTRGFLHAFFSEIFDIDDPPLYKQFLRIDGDPGTLTISCFAAIGTEAADDPPALEDQVRISLRGTP